MFGFLKKRETVTKTRGKPLHKRFGGFSSGLLTSLTNSWTTSSVSADQVILQNLATLRARSRDQYYNNDYAKRFVTECKNNIVGSNGFTLQSKAFNSVGEDDKAAQAAIEKAWKNWNKPKNCDVKEQLSFTSILNLIVTSLIIDGEAFIQVNRGENQNFKIKVLDPVLIDINYHETLSNGNNIIFGIEYNADQKAVAYHVTDQDHGYKNINVYHTGARRRISADNMIHVYAHEMTDQRRGIPWMSTSLERMKMLAGFEEASLVAARIGAAKMGFFYSDSGDEYHGDLDAGLSVSAEAGTFEQLPKNTRFEAFNPDYPKGEYEIFAKQALRGIASGFGISYNTLANDLEGVNFSSMRHGAIAERETWKCLQQLIIEQFLEPVFDKWIEFSQLSQTIKIGNKHLARSVDFYRPAIFQPKRWAWVDPLKEIQAKREEHLIGVTSISQIIRDKGLDPETVFEEIRKERETLNELGITPQNAGFFVSGDQENAVEE